MAAETEQGLKRSHRGPSPVEPKDKLVEVDLQMLGGHALVGALQPALEVVDGPVDARQDVVEGNQRWNSMMLRGKSGLTTPQILAEGTG